MNRPIVLVLVAVASCLVLTTGDAQVKRKPSSVNPYTGQVLVSAVPYNSLTGKAHPAGPAAKATTGWPRGEPPVSGKAGAGLEALDKAVRTIMDRHGIPGAALAVARNGKLIYAKGQGWADLASEA